jgi:two-component system sensor histidine kinase CpxA
MKIRLPLSAKILLWFFLNLAVLALGIILLLNAQFSFDLDWVFASSARQRVDAIRDLIVYELNTTAPDDWDRVIERFSNAYHVRISIFEHNGTHLIGRTSELPEEVRARLVSDSGHGHATPMRSPKVPPPSPGGSAGVVSKPQPTRLSMPSPPSPRMLLRTLHPTRYWLLLRARLDNPQAGSPMRVVLVAEAESLSVGGLIIDPTPWLRLALGMLVFSVLFWFPLLRGISRSVSQMTHSTREIAEGRFDIRIPTTRGDELGSLAESINQMAARLNGFVKGQKRFLGDIAHELCSPLARLQMVLGILEQRADPAHQSYVKSATEKAGQIASLVNELLAFSRASFGSAALSLVPVNVREAVETAVLREAYGAVKIQREIDSGLLALSDSELLVRAIANLIRNAIRHAGENEPIVISARKEGEQVAISIADSGPGVPEEELTKIFDAFYRLDTARTRETGGTGLGLTIVKTCMEACGGSVSARNRSPHGLEVVLRFPVERANPAAN